MAEIFGRRTASAQRQGRLDAHRRPRGQGMLGANGIVGGGPPLICGVGLSAKMRGTDQVGVSFIGDGGSNQGTFLESLNLAAVWNAAVRSSSSRTTATPRRPSSHLPPGRRRRRQARRRLRHARRDRRRLRLLRRLRGRRRGDRARPRGRRADAARVQGHPLLRALRGRRADLPRRERGRGRPRANRDLPDAVPRSASPPRAWSTPRSCDAIDDEVARSIDEAVARGARPARSPTEADLLTDVYVSY